MTSSSSDHASSCEDRLTANDASSGGGGGQQLMAANSWRRKRYMPRRKRRDSLLRSLVIMFGVSLLYVALYGGGAEEPAAAAVDSDTPSGAAHVFQRKLLQTEKDTSNVSSSGSDTAAAGAGETSSVDGTEKKDDDALFPKDAFTVEQRRQGAVILHIIGIVYMFYALALVCDEFFVPSLDVITEKLQISPDVAGATFMAAGGSAPELFTSIIGVFIAKSDVGIGTIVGSAVFNILFVIAACAFAAKEALQLTAWPLIRDVFFYSVSLVLLVVFFMDNKIRWYEALILFLWYFAYVGFMKINEPVEDKLRQCFKLNKRERNPLERGVTLRAAQHRKGLFHLMNETINPGILHRPKSSPPEDGKELEMKPLNPKPEIMIGEPGSAAGISKLKSQMQAGSVATDVSTAAAAGTGNGNSTSKELEDMTGGENHATPAAAEDREAAAGAAADSNNSAKQHNNEMWASSTSVNPATAAAAAEAEAGSGGQKAAAAAADDDEEEEQPIDMSFPKDHGWKAIIVYLISFPIMAPLFITLPDTKKEKMRKFFVITFLGSILWIAVFSYLMVWWATTTGEALKIPSTVMGLTFLAAGTSVPDLITSVLVAKKGKGDMAVSSSVGSNIFDVCVGLPLPWLLYTAVFQDSINVNSAGVGCSVSLLFIMLILVFISILIFQWKMTRAMGVMMMVLYFIFVIVTLGFTELFGWYKCPV